MPALPTSSRPAALRLAVVVVVYPTPIAPAGLLVAEKIFIKHLINWQPVVTLAFAAVAGRAGS